MSSSEHPKPLIRYSVAMNTSPAGLYALSFVASLKRLGHPVRLLSVAGPADLGGKWAAHLELLNTPLTKPFINVVCAPPACWIRGVTVRVPKDGAQAPRELADVLLPDARVASSMPAGPTVPIKQATELYVPGMRNILIVPPTTSPGGDQITTGLKYEAIVLGDMADSEFWRSVRDYAGAAVLQGENIDGERKLFTERFPIRDHVVITNHTQAVRDLAMELVV